MLKRNLCWINSKKHKEELVQQSEHILIKRNLRWIGPEKYAEQLAKHEEKLALQHGVDIDAENDNILCCTSLEVVKLLMRRGAYIHK